MGDTDKTRTIGFIFIQRRRPGREMSPQQQLEFYRQPAATEAHCFRADTAPPLLLKVAQKGIRMRCWGRRMDMHASRGCYFQVSRTWPGTWKPSERPPVSAFSVPKFPFFNGRSQAYSLTHPPEKQPMNRLHMPSRPIAKTDPRRIQPTSTLLPQRHQPLVAALALFHALQPPKPLIAQQHTHIPLDPDTRQPHPQVPAARTILSLDAIAHRPRQIRLAGRRGQRRANRAAAAVLEPRGGHLQDKVERHCARCVAVCETALDRGQGGGAGGALLEAPPEEAACESGGAGA